MGELSQFMADHFRSDEDGEVVFAVMNQETQASMRSQSKQPATSDMATDPTKLGRIVQARACVFTATLRAAASCKLLKATK